MKVPQIRQLPSKKATLFFFYAQSAQKSANKLDRFCTSAILEIRRISQTQSNQIKKTTVFCGICATHPLFKADGHAFYAEQGNQVKILEHIPGSEYAVNMEPFFGRVCAFAKVSHWANWEGKEPQEETSFLPPYESEDLRSIRACKIFLRAPSQSDSFQNCRFLYSPRKYSSERTLK